MKKLDNIDQLEALFRSKLDKAEVPAPDVWSGVAREIGVKASLSTRIGEYFSSVTNVVKVALFVGGVSTVGILLYQANKPASTNPAIQEEFITLPSQDAGQADHSSEGGELLSQEGSQISQSPNATSQNSNVAGPQDATQPMPEGGVQPDGVETADGAANGQDPSGQEGVDLHDAPALSIESMGHAACIGETRTFISADHRKGDWYINAQEVKSDADVMSHRFTDPGQYSVSLKVGEEIAVYTITISGYNGYILAAKQADGQHELKLSDPQAEVQEWIMEGEVVSKAQVLERQLKVGKNFVQVKLKYNGCTVSKDKVIEVKGAGSFSSPNIFTPNGDGRNDDYKVDITHYSSFFLQVIDGNRQRVFATTDPEQAWDGTNQLNGSDCPDGVYQVIVKYQLEGEAEQTSYIKLTLKR